MPSIRALYDHTFPLGPVVAEISGTRSVDTGQLSLLFDSQNKLVNQLNKELSLIIGRKGSGKTTLLSSVQLTDKDAPYFYLPSPDLFARIMREINNLSDGVVFVEQVSRLWDFVLWGIVFQYISFKHKVPALVEYCAALGVAGEQSPYETISAMLKSVKEFPPSDWPLPEKIAYKKIGSISFLQAKQIAIKSLRDIKERVYLLMDSLEDFKLDLPNYGTAVAGLLRCVGEFNENKDAFVTLRCCLPAERYHEFSNLSTNPLKDFRRGMLLHWSAGELIHLCATRLTRYIQEYHPEQYREHFVSLDIRKRDELDQFWRIIFSRPVVNGLGTEERPIAYILRHSQLLPRHVLVLLNEVISRSLKQDDGRIIDIDPNFVRSGVAEKEADIYRQIVEAYRTPTRNPQEIAENVLRELSSVFTLADFDRVAARIGRRLSGFDDRGDLLAFLAEIGAVGRVVGGSDRYVEGVFEYMLPSKLIFSERDQFCIHPIFSQTCNVSVDYEGVKPVYTYWSGIVDSELEHWM